MKKILTLIALATIFLSCITTPSFADLETAKQDVVSNNPDLAYLGYGSDGKLWFIDTKSIQNREAENGAKYWIANVYLFCESNYIGRNARVDFGTIKRGKQSYPTYMYRYAINKKQPQIQILALEQYHWVGQDASESRAFNVNRWVEFSENTLGAEVYKYVNEHGGSGLGNDTFAGKGLMIIVVAIVAIGAIFAVKRKNSKGASTIKDAGNIIQSAVNKCTDTVVDIAGKKQADIADEHKFCRKCGAKVDVNAKFCGKCGEKFNS